jgi:hypothetical protein
MGTYAQEALVEMDEDHDLRDQVGLEVCCLQLVVVEKLAEECSCGQAESLIIKGSEDHRLGPVL